MGNTEESIQLLKLENTKLKKENYYLKEFIRKIKLAILNQLKSE